MAFSRQTQTMGSGMAKASAVHGYASSSVGRRLCVCRLPVVVEALRETARDRESSWYLAADAVRSLSRLPNGPKSRRTAAADGHYLPTEPLPPPG